MDESRPWTDFPLLPPWCAQLAILTRTQRRFSPKSLSLRNFPVTCSAIHNHTVERTWIIRMRDLWSRSGAKIARISALPFFLIASTGWIPARDLDLPPRGPWPWGVILGLFLVAIGTVGIFLPENQSSQRSSRSSS